MKIIYRIGTSVQSRYIRMTVLRMTSPVTPPSSSPGSNEAQAPQAISKPVHRLSFSVAALLADTKKSDASSVSPRSSPLASYSPVRHDQLSITNSTPLQKYPTIEYRSRYLSTSPTVQEHRSSNQYTCDAPRTTLVDARTLARLPEIEEVDRTCQSPRSRTLDYVVQTESGSTPEVIACSSSPKMSSLTRNNHPEFGPQSPRSSSHEGRSRCSEPEDIEEEDENSLVDVEDLQHHHHHHRRRSSHDEQGSSPTPVRPTPAYIGGFSGLGGISGIPTGLHPAVWGGGHQGAAAAAAAASFFPSHFSHHAPLNGE